MKVNQRIALTKRLFQEALLRLLEKKALDKISVTELCNEAGINRATFYRHYNIPRDVLLEMEMEFTENINPSFLPYGQNDATEHLYTLCMYLYNNSELIKIFIQNNSEEDLIVLTNNFFRRLLEKKDTLKNLDSFDDVDLKLITTCVAGGGYFMLRQWLLEDIKKSPREMADLILAFISYTSSTIVSHKQNND